MKKTFYFSVVAAVFSFGLVSFAAAASIFDITYPIAELGGCADQAACKAYCDDLSNKNACIAFSEKMGFVSKEKAEEAKALPSSGPGGCASQEACRTYCDDPAHEDECVAFGQRYGLLNKGSDVSERAKLIQEEGGPGKCRSEKECRAFCENPAHEGECLDFAEKHNLGDKKQIQSAKKVQDQGGPGGCKSEKECHAYCENPDNSETCIAFAEGQGFMSKEEAARARQFSNKPGPGGCRGEACKMYCEDSAHQEECIAFAVENGFMSKEDAERAKKFAGKPGPGGCKGEQCKEFCHDPANEEACFQFAVENDLIPKDEIERVKKFKNVANQGGPGGCHGDQCRLYCENPAHQDECFKFAKERGLLGEEELKMAERGRELSKKVKEVGGPGGCKSDNECQAFCRNPDNVEACLAFAVEHGGFKPEEAKGMLKRFVEDSVRMRGPRGPGEFGMPSSGSPGRMMSMGLQEEFGQGGMQNAEFERQFEDRFQRFEQLRGFEDKFRRPEIGQMQGGPGGCQGPEECMKYCSDSAHQQECMNASPQEGMMPSGSGPFDGGRGFGGSGQMGMPQDAFGKCVAGGGTIVKSEPPALPKCVNKDGSEVTLPADVMRGEGGTSGSMAGSAVCSGPKPLMPVPVGCTGPVCKEGRWGFDCYQGERGDPPTPGMMPPIGTQQPTAPTTMQIREGVACTEEWRPVCGTNGRTYPNACFAKADNMTVAKMGACESAELKPADGTYPQPYPGYYPPPADPYPSGDQYRQFTPPPTEIAPPQTRRSPPDIFFATILEAFRNLLPH